MVSRLHAGHAFTDLHDDTGPFVAENHRENALRIVPGEGKGIGVADTGVGIFNQHLAFLGGATSISTISGGFHGANATAARDFICKLSSM